MNSLINSISAHFGALVVVPGTGFALQSRGAGFTMEESHPNRVAPDKRPFHTIIPAFVSKHGQPWLSFGVMGGPMQPQGHVQVLLNMVEFEMDVQQACEAANIISSQMQSSFGEHVANPGRLTLNRSVAEEVRKQLEAMGYEIRVRNKTSGPLTAIWFDWKNGTMWGGASDYGDDYGIAW